jgi:serine/threonine-protein kinase RIO1
MHSEVVTAHSSKRKHNNNWKTERKTHRNVELSYVGSCSVWMRFVASMSYGVMKDNISEQKESNFFTKHNFSRKHFAVNKFRKKVSAAQYMGNFFIFSSY